MRQLLLTAIFLLSCLCAMAVPAKRGLWRNITTTDGITVRAELVGDELCHFWRTADGQAYTEGADGVFEPADVAQLAESVADERAKINASRRARMTRNFGDATTRSVGTLVEMDGQKRGIVILVQFADQRFTDEHTKEYYNQVLNECGPKENGYTGGLKQYFIDQSNGRFILDFDVYGPVTLPQPYSYYGEDKYGEGNDARADNMMREAIIKANKDYNIDWSPYDWDGDDLVEQVSILYAGYGQATKPDDPDLVWPHETEFGSPIQLTGTGKRVNTVACSNELDINQKGTVIDSGIGTFCHEFAHCLGYPDTYDVDYSCNTTAMDIWDLMDTGAYNGDSFTPAPLTAYEKMTAGWLKPVELDDNTAYTGMRPVTEADGGDVYIMHNPSHDNEFYIFENIKNEGWCSGMYKSKGLLITHVDFKREAWVRNIVNCKQSPGINNHSRYTYIPADGSCNPSTASDIRGDLYPFTDSAGQKVDSFCGTWYNGTRGDCDIVLSNITLATDGTISFVTGTPTAIGGIEAELLQVSAPACYNIHGQRIDSENYHGIIIKNGKKQLKL